MLLLYAAPFTAFALNLLHPVATTLDRAWYLALTQIAVFVALIRLDIWLHVRSGVNQAGSVDEAVGRTVAIIVGLLLTGLTAAGARLGCRLAARPRGSHDAG